MKKNEVYFLLIIFGFALFYMSCDSKSTKDDFSYSDTRKPFFTDTEKQVSEDEKDEAVDKNAEVSLEEKESLKEKLKEDFFKIVKGFERFKNSDTPFSDTYHLFVELGLEPTSIQDDLGNIGIRGEVVVNGLRYFAAKFNGVDSPTYFSFELEPVKGAYQAASELVAEIYENIGEPCFISENKNAVAYQVDDYLLRVYENTYDDIERGDPNKPRSSEDIGSVEVIIEQDIHGICGKSTEEILEEPHDH